MQNHEIERRKMKRVKMRDVSGIYDVWAEIIGELAVFEGDNGYWTVGHVLSGAWVAGWTHKHVALNYAKRISRLFSIDYFFMIEDTQYRILVSEAIRNYRKHPAHVMNCADATAENGVPV